jgi:hypothetical protein
MAKSIRIIGEPDNRLLLKIQLKKVKGKVKVKVALRGLFSTAALWLIVLSPLK